MNEELPKSLREALARQTSGDVHPSADALTAFVERGLLGRENQQVTDHLAKCKDCREVVFLASSVVEEPVGEEQEWMPVAAVPRISPALLAKAEGAQATARTAPVDAPPRRGWMLRWAWVPAVAVVALVSAVLIRRAESPRSAPQSTLTMASKVPPTEAMNGQRALGTSIELESQAKAAPPKSMRPQAKPAQNSDALNSASGGSKAAGEYRFATAEMSAPKPLSPPPSALAYQAAPLAVPRQNSFVEGEAPAASGLVAKSQLASEKPQAAMLPAVVTRPQWRVTPDGHLERWTAPGAWTPVLTDQPATFHVVSVVGNNVWAGGSGGVLFHSNDGGQNWSRVKLSSPSGVETGIIVSVQFGDQLHGVITTDQGAHWTTSDGGVIWTKE